MPDSPAPTPEDRAARERELLAQADSQNTSILSEFWAFLMQNKKWWLTPILLAFLIIGALIVFGTSTAGPFVYTLF